MRAHGCRLMTLLAVGFVYGCSGMKGQPFDPNLVGRELYLCCNMHFNPELRATDANYTKYLYKRSYETGSPMLAAGTRLRVVKVGSSGVEFQPEGGAVPYAISFNYGRKQQTPDQYFRNILRATNPMDAVKDAPRTITTAIREDRLVQGMTREQALLARGYPPAHRTPSLESNEWLYYETPGFVDRVVFADGKIQSITHGPAPQ